MPKFSSNKKIISGILITVMIALNFSFIAIPKRAEAIPTIQIGNVWQIAQDVVAKVFRAAVRRLVMMLAQDIANWISNGFQGNPSFLNDPARFAKNVADVAIGDFIYNDPSLSFLCKPFQLQLKLSLALQHRNFYQTVNCTLSGVLQNGKDAYANFASGDFINGGGWDTFLTMVTDPNATPEGAFLVMDSELTARIETKQGALDKELSQGQGSLSFRNCTETTYKITSSEVDGTITKEQVSQREYTGNPFYDKSDNTTTDSPQAEGGGSSAGESEGVYTGVQKETNCKVTSPGALIAERLFFGQESSQRMSEMQAVMGSAFDTIIGALTNYLVDKLMGSVLNSGGDQNYTDVNTMITDLQSQQSANETANNNIAAGGSIGGGSTYGTDSLFNSRTAAQNTLRDQLTLESVYQNNQSNLLNYISGMGNNSMKGVFTTAKACNNTYSSSDPLNATRAENIQSNVLDAIDGAKNTSNGTYLLSPNAILIANNIATSTANISALNTRLTLLETASTAAEIQSLATLNTPPFHTSGETVITNITTMIYNWANQKANTYSTALCPISVPTY